MTTPLVSTKSGKYETLGRAQLLFLANEQARGGADAAHQAADRLRELGLDVVTAEPRNADEANAIIREHRDEISGVIIGGGDGTVSGALPAVLELQLPLGILPMGTANDFARTLDIPDDVPSACETIARGRTRAVDVADVNGHYFVNNAAIGLPCEMAGETSRDAKKVLGALASLALLPRVARYARPFRARLIYDGRVESSTTNAILVGNGRYDGGFPVKYVDVDDGLLSVAMSTTRNAYELLRTVFAAWRNSANRGERVTRFDTRELRVETGTARRICADGDIVSSTPAKFTIRPAALTVFVP
jgi:diacylglycerol kinase (ATP)